MRHQKTFLNVEKSSDNSKYDATFIGVNFCSAKWLNGVQYAAKKIRDLSYRYSNSDSTSYPIKIYNPEYGYIMENIMINDFGNINVSKYNKNFIEAKFPIFVGGDHASTYYILKNFIKDKALTIIHFDAHSDYLNEFIDCPHGSVMYEIHKLKNIGKIVHCGLRGNLNTGPGISRSIKDGNVVINRDELDYNKISKNIKKRDDIYISIDTDFFDTSIAPGTNCPEPNGFLYKDFLNIIVRLLNDYNVIGMDFVEYNPKKDLSDITGILLTNLIIECISAKKGKIK